MMSIQEEREDYDRGVSDSSRPMWRRLFVDKDPAVGNGVAEGGSLEVSPSTGSRGLVWSEQESATATKEGHAEEFEGGEASDQDGEPEDGEEYWGSLKRSTVEGYEARIEAIKAEIEELDVDGLKGKVLCTISPTPAFDYPED